MDERKRDGFTRSDFKNRDISTMDERKRDGFTRSDISDEWHEDSANNIIHQEADSLLKNSNPVSALNKTAIVPQMPRFSDSDIKIAKVNDFQTPKRNIKANTSHLMTAPRILSNDGNDSLFLKSLSADFPDWKRHPIAQRFMNNFNSLKTDLTSKLFKIFNKNVFKDELPETISLEWNPRLTKTAGTFSYRRRTCESKITLSPKVCDSPERVRDTLAHEMCHAAVKLISGITESHGPAWKSWARKVTATYSFLPVVARCHNYIINTKYTYQCVNCKYRVQRHSKSLDTDRKVCGHCHSKFELFLSKNLNSSKDSVSYTPRAPNKFASYVKEHYSEKKKRYEGIKHGEVMRLLSKEFATKNKIAE